METYALRPPREAPVAAVMIAVTASVALHVGALGFLAPFAFAPLPVAAEAPLPRLDVVLVDAKRPPQPLEAPATASPATLRAAALRPNLAQASPPGANAQPRAASAPPSAATAGTVTARVDAARDEPGRANAARVPPAQEAPTHSEVPVRILAAAVPSPAQPAAPVESATIAPAATPASTSPPVASLQGAGTGVGDAASVGRATSSAGSASASAHAAAAGAQGATPVAYLDAPPPAYPESARRDGLQGLAVIEVLVSKNGTPLEIRIAKTSGVAALDSAAVAGVRKWRFTPATRDREPVDARITIPIRFRLDGDS